MTPLLKGFAFVALYTLGSIGVALLLVWLARGALERRRLERELELRAYEAFRAKQEAELQRLMAMWRLTFHGPEGLAKLRAMQKAGKQQSN